LFVFNEIWYNERSQCGDVHIVLKGNPIQLFFKELRPQEVAFSLKNTLSLQLLLNPLDVFDKTWYKERSHCVDVQIVRGTLSNFFQGVMVPGLSIFFEKYFVFSTLPEPFGGF
jgi:hypothetical protein